MRRSFRNQEGFTLIELMVVVLIIGILVAIALPAFLGARTRAQDSAAKARLRTALVGAKAYYTDQGFYTDFAAGNNAENEETGTVWEHSDVEAVKGVVTINLAFEDELLLSSASESGTAFCIYSNEGPGVPMVRGQGDGWSGSTTWGRCYPPSTSTW